LKPADGTGTGGAALELCKFKLSRRSETSKLGKIKDVGIDTVISHVRGTSKITVIRNSLLKDPDE